LCDSIGSKWEFQSPTDWGDQINEENKFLFHFEDWERGEIDKHRHCFWFIAGGPGCGKSRSLDEFPKVLQNAASRIENSDRLQRRLQNMCIFKISFENGTGISDGLPERSVIPAHMAYQLQESSLSWIEFIGTPAAKNMTFDTIVHHLLTILEIPKERDLTMLLLIDGLQVSGSALENIVNMICELSFCTDPFILIACSTTTTIRTLNFLNNVSIRSIVTLTPPPISEPLEITRLFESLVTYDKRLITKIMMQDMGGHGRALECLLETLKECDLNHVSANTVMQGVTSKLRLLYKNWNILQNQDEVQGLLVSVFCRAKLKLNEVIPGTTVTVDEIMQAGLFRYDDKEGTLSVAYIWILLMKDFNRFPELTAIINMDYESIQEKIRHGSSPSLSPEAFEEFWCNFRAVRSRCFRNEFQLLWSVLHSGALITNGGDIKVENNHLSFTRAASRFATKSSIQDTIKLVDGADIANESRDALLDKVILNGAGAPSGDSLVVLKLSNGTLCSEAHQCKRFNVSTLTTDAVRKEREKAADPGDFFVLICSGKFAGQVDQLPDRTALVDADCFVQYFGPFAGRAFIYKHSGPLDANVASAHQLQQCFGIGRIYAQKVLKARQQKLFSDPADFKKRVANFSDAIMEQFYFGP
jgi:hypothetical protein